VPALLDVLLGASRFSKALETPLAARVFKSGPGPREGADILFLGAPREIRVNALAALRAPLLHGLTAGVVTAIFVAWATRTILAEANLTTLTLNILLRGSDPFLGKPLAQAVPEALGRSLVLVLAALLGAALLGLLAGAAYALSPSRLVRSLSWGLGTVGVSLPSFFWAMLLQLVVVLWFVRTRTTLLPTAGYGIDEHLILPAIAVGMRPAAYLFRTTATALDEVRHGDYVRSARAKGLMESLIARRHIFPNAAPAIFGGLGLAMRSALSSLAIVEYVFSWNGAGLGFIHAVANGRTDFAVATAVGFALLFALVGVVVGTAGRFFDPRIPR